MKLVVAVLALTVALLLQDAAEAMARGKKRERKSPAFVKREGAVDALINDPPADDEQRSSFVEMGKDADTDTDKKEEFDYYEPMYYPGEDSDESVGNYNEY